MMQVLRILALGVGLFCCSAAIAQEAGKKPVKPLASRPASKPLVRPQPSPLDPRLVVFPYTPNYIYPVPTKLNDFTHIEFPEGERVIDVTLPDKLRWAFKVSKATKRDIFIKPIIPNNRSSATIITNVRRYELALSVGDEEDGGEWYQRVSWDSEDSDTSAGADMSAMDMAATPTATSVAMPFGRSPGADFPVIDAGSRKDPSALCRQGQVPVDQINFEYDIAGDAPFKPLMVFDNGRSTWIKFPAVQDMPSLFALDPETGNAEFETFISCPGNFVVVQAMLPGGALLKLGKSEVRIVNKKTPRKNSSCGGFFGLFGNCNKPVGNIRDQ